VVAIAVVAVVFVVRGGGGGGVEVGGGLEGVGVEAGGTVKEVEVSEGVGRGGKEGKGAGGDGLGVDVKLFFGVSEAEYGSVWAVGGTRKVKEEKGGRAYTCEPTGPPIEAFEQLGLLFSRKVD
jgi:hypothetical protein